MPIEKDGRTLRKKLNDHFSDKEFLISYYEKHQKFPLFTQVLIETRTDCNLKCSFCPQTHHKRNVEIMEWNIFVKIIESLSSIEFGGRIALLVSNEPLLEKRLNKMIRFSKRTSARFFLDLTTNGTLLSLENVDELIESGLDNLNINDYRADREKEPNIVSENLLPILEKYRGNPKIIYNSRSTNEILPNYAGVIKQTCNPKEYGFCNYPFRKIVFSMTGDVLLCCNDFKHETTFGHIMEQEIKSIWNSIELDQIRLNLLNGNRDGLCSKCNEVQSYEVF